MFSQYNIWLSIPRFGGGGGGGVRVKTACKKNKSILDKRGGGGGGGGRALYICIIGTVHAKIALRIYKSNVIKLPCV